MPAELPEETATRVFGSGSWPWIAEALKGSGLDYNTATGAGFATTIIEAAHGDSEQLAHYIEASSLDQFQESLHREWLDIEMPFSKEERTRWFVEVVRAIAPLAITQLSKKLHAQVSRRI